MAEKLKFELTLFPNPLLRRPCPPVEAFDDELRATVEAMYELMYASQGVGLAAPQVGLRKRILVLNPTGKPEDELTLINPVLIEKSGPEVMFEEGCLSFPAIYAEIERPDRCRVEACDVDGNPIQGEYEGFISRIIQHEQDHLEGVLLVDRMSPADKQRHRAALEDLVEGYKRRQGASR
ncbi:MAG: peptide deformylase [Planctomycetota bacterium]